eukprot:g8000.t1
MVASVSTSRLVQVSLCVMLLIFAHANCREFEDISHKRALKQGNRGGGGEGADGPGDGEGLVVWSWIYSEGQSGASQLA